jgi:hypothetical protein
VQVQVAHLPGSFWACSRYPKAMLDGHMPTRLPCRAVLMIRVAYGARDYSWAAAVQDRVYRRAHKGRRTFRPHQLPLVYNLRHLTDARHKQLSGLVGQDLKAARDWAIKWELPPLELPSRSLVTPLKTLVQQATYSHLEPMCSLASPLTRRLDNIRPTLLLGRHSCGGPGHR